MKDYAVFEERDEEQVRQQYLPETECLWYIGHSHEHRHLLKHPVIALFVMQKWSKIKELYRRNHRFFFIFVTLLTWYTFSNYGKNKSNIFESPDLDWQFFLYKKAFFTKKIYNGKGNLKKATAP